MKKWIVFSLSLLILVMVLTASAEAPAIEVRSVLTRNIKVKGRNVNGSFPNNPVITGESPTTGLPTSNSSFVPILVQIDNNVGPVPQWGISSADIIYEFPIQGQGWTRLTALFSDEYPQEAGPVRSGRVMHADLREEWDALLVHYGKQEAAGSDMKEALRNYGVTAKGLDIDGIGNKYQNYFARVKYHVAPHNVSAYVHKLYELMLEQGYKFSTRPFKFTDDLNYGGAVAEKINVIHKGNKDTRSTFVYNTAENAYYRFIESGAYFDLLKPAEQLSYSNVIVQRTKLSFNGHSMNPVLPEVVGTGACDMFIGGQYIAGVWARHKPNERTVFFDQNGNEISLQRGKTWVIICDDTSQVVIGDLDKTQTNLFVTEPADVTEQSLVNPTAVSEDKTAAPAIIESQPTPQPEGVAVEATESINTAIVQVANNGLLNMRKAASKTSNIISRIRSGSLVQVLSADKDWTNISFDGIEGYVVSDYLVITQSGVTAEYSPLKSGDRGDEVLNLKKRLYELGYLRTSKLNDRYIQSTVDAVREFERQNGLTIDGAADSEMLKLLYSNEAKKQ